MPLGHARMACKSHINYSLFPVYIPRLIIHDQHKERKENWFEHETRQRESKGSFVKNLVYMEID